MTALPPGLKGWQRLLALFDPKTIAALLPMVDRLARLLGPMAPEASLSSGEPAGYDGVSTRGPYERLLPSEWLLADEIPDEFLRRAIAREHLFFALAREEPRGKRASTVLVDGGPELFGTPRIGALAALLVLAQRSSTASATFSWRFAQAPTDGFTDVAPAAIRAFVSTRASFAPTEEALATAIEGARALGEVWLIAGPLLGGIGRRLRASVVAIDDVLEPGVRALSVAVSVCDRPAQRVQLPLPSDQDCLRLLRDPFPQEAPVAARSKGRAAFALARPVVAFGRPSVFARLEDGSLFVVSLPVSKLQDVGKGRTHAASGIGEIVAAGNAGRKPAAIAQQGDVFTLATWRTKAGLTRHVGSAIEPLRPPTIDGRLFPLFSIGDATFFVARGGRLVEFRAGKRVRVLTSDCTGVSASRETLTYASDAHGDTHLFTAPLEPGKDTFAWLVLPGAGETFLAHTVDGVLVCAYEEQHDSWVAMTFPATPVVRDGSAPLPRFNPEAPPPGTHVIRSAAASGDEVVGVIGLPEGESLAPRVLTPAIVFLIDGGRALGVSRGRERAGFMLPLPVRALYVVVDARTRVAACITDTAELLLVALDWRAVVARFGAAGRVV